MSKPVIGPGSFPALQKSGELMFEPPVEKALQEVARIDGEWRRQQTDEAARSLLDDVELKKTISAIGTVENAASALAVAMTYLREYPAGPIDPEHIKLKMVGHIGATTAISRTYVNAAAALKDPAIERVIHDHGIRQAHVVTGPGHGAAAIFALLFLEGALERIYPDRYPRTAAGLQNLIADFCRPNSPLPSHVFPGVPTVSEGGELGYSFGIAAGAGLANPDAIVVAQIGDKESEAGPLQASLENHNAIYDFRKGLVLPVVHANGLGISGTAIISARTDAELSLYLRGLGYSPFIVDAEANPWMRAADEKARQLGAMENLPLSSREKLEGEVRQLRQKSADLTNALLQRYTRKGIYNLGKKREVALAHDAADKRVRALEAKVAAEPKDAIARGSLEKARAERDALATKLRGKRTPIIIYREAKGGGHAPAFVHDHPTKGAPISHQLILNAQDLLSKGPRTREILDLWLHDLTDGRGVAGLLPNPGTVLGEATRTAFPKDSLLSGSASLALGRTAAPPVAQSAESYLRPLKGGRGEEQAGGNDLVDAYLKDYLVLNEGNAFLLSADTVESNRLKRTVAALGRRFNLETGKNHPASSGPTGQVIDVLSEQYLMSLAQGMVNSGKQAIISNYEAFFQISASMVRQFIKFRKQAGEANATARREGNPTAFRPPVPNLVLHLSSTAFEQDHNGFSHQNAGLVHDLLADPRPFVAVYMPPDAGTAVLQTAKAVSGTGQVAALVVDKQPRAQFLHPEEARELAEVGGAHWAFASSVDPAKETPDVVLAASGGYHTDEVLAASQILKSWNQRLAGEGKQGIRFTTVNIAEPLKLRAPADQDDAAVKIIAALGRKKAATTDGSVFDQETFDRLFPPGAAVVYNFAGFRTTAQSLFAGRDRRVSSHGYQNEGSTTTRFDMMARNDCDRFTLVVDAVLQAEKAGAIDPATAQRVQKWCTEQLVRHDQRMARGEEVDPKEITGGVWPGGGGIVLGAER
ncbi:MAG: hypothetical protein IT384_06825 [Deltaproteobacteria bacterium]|nr:hypothetical protein [Deltaproteobacteria bacterium]